MLKFWILITSICFCMPTHMHFPTPGPFLCRTQHFLCIPPTVHAGTLAQSTAHQRSLFEKTTWNKGYKLETNWLFVKTPARGRGFCSLSTLSYLPKDQQPQQMGIRCETLGIRPVHPSDQRLLTHSWSHTQLWLCENTWWETSKANTKKGQ